MFTWSSSFSSARQSPTQLTRTHIQPEKATSLPSGHSRAEGNQALPEIYGPPSCQATLRARGKGGCREFHHNSLRWRWKCGVAMAELGDLGVAGGYRGISGAFV